ncbi:hypothetical protein [Moraxella nonliquefaciens]|jgi:hypothetical protein|uniref:HEPN domain-containing protein n=1 Tax=Moraxella nonliquefaciens TaxID=478 RepID=A0A1B8PKG7_MORNO|nr:hypothetical protein [Moraxella nonliquefaciens]OBX51475.1 hypothetical protein A9Z60_07765 [Moraxella nonliquefaciens]
MSVTTTDLHETVNQLFGDIDSTSSEALWRAYINRSYYAVFHELRLAMEQADISTNQYKTGTHDNLYRILDEMAVRDKSIKKLALQFKDFLKKRHQSDYKLHEHITWTDVVMAQKYARELPELIAKYIK